MIKWKDDFKKSDTISQTLVILTTRCHNFTQHYLMKQNDNIKNSFTNVNFAKLCTLSWVKKRHKNLNAE